jgi:signal transduction histidine kinase
MAVATRTGGLTEAREQWQTLLHTLTADALDEPLPHLLQRSAQSACDVVGCRYAVIGIVDETGALEHLVPAGVDPRSVRPIGRRPLQGGLLGTVIVESRTIRLPAPGIDPASVGLPADHPATNSLLGVPIRYDGQTVGALYLSEPDDGRAFTVEHEQLAELVAAAVAAVVKRIRLAAAYEQRQRWLTESAELSRTLLSGEHNDPLRLVVERVLAIAESQLVCMVAERPDGAGYEVIEAAGVREAQVRGQLIERARTVAAKVIADGTPTMFTDLAHTEAYAEIVAITGADAAILVPLSGPGVTRGILAVFRGPGQAAFTTAEVEASRMLAAQVTLALQLAESHAHRERIALLDERDRIARDLHDHVIQRLFAIGLTVQSAGTQVDGDTAKRLIGSVDDIDETIVQIRSTIYRLTGPILSADTSVRARVSRLIDEMEPVLGFRAELDVRGPLDFGIDEDITDDCLAVVREALTNVARHAEASRVDVLVSVSPSALAIEVNDNGRGMGPGARRSGLANLRARAERHDGRLTFESSGSQGTRLSWWVPLRAVVEVARSAG